LRKDESTPITVITLSPPAPFISWESEELNKHSPRALSDCWGKSLGSCQLGDTMEITADRDSAEDGAASGLRKGERP
jgi:hypothetical protein